MSLLTPKLAGDWYQSTVELAAMQGADWTLEEISMLTRDEINFLVLQLINREVHR